MLHVEHLVVGVFIVHHVKTRTNIGGVRSLGHKLQGDLVSFGRYTVGASVLLVGTLNLVSDRIVLVGIERVLGMLDGTTILCVELLHSNQLAGVGASSSDKLGGDCHWLGCINLVLAARTIESLALAHETSVLDVATISVSWNSWFCISMS